MVNGTTQYRLADGSSFLYQSVDTGNRRCIFISDIHGELALLQTLLKKVQFQAEDHLFLLGDICEKGSNSLETLRYVMQLAQGGNVHTLQGNCDVWNKELNPAKATPWLRDYLNRRRNSLCTDMCRELGIVLTPTTDLAKMKGCLWNAYPDELAFLGQLPRVIEIDQALMVHAALQQEVPPFVDTAYTLVKYDQWARSAPAFRKWVICGHMPVINYCEEIADLNPRIDHQKHIISIDGGNVIHACGQLNAFIMQGDQISNVSVDPLPEIYAIGDQNPSQSGVTINWYNAKVTVLQQEPWGIVCRHDASGRVLRVPHSRLYYPDQSTSPSVGIYTDYCLEVHTGDVLKLWETHDDWCLCKKAGVLGWVKRSILHR